MPCLRTSVHSTIFSMESTPPGFELKNRFSALDEKDSDDAIPLVSAENFSPYLL